MFPLPKILNPENFSDTRPILEKVIVNQLRKYVETNKILLIYQSGFRQGHGCSTALLDITDDIFGVTDRGKLTLLMLLDYSRAFGSLQYEVLRSIFHYIGLSELQ